MGMTITYNILFEVKVLHHYLLNRGMKNLALMTENEQAEMMLNYDVRDIFTITPTAECRKHLDRHQCLCKQTPLGIIVGLKAELVSQNPKKYRPFHPIDDDLVFTFHLHLKDFGLLNYTDLPLTGDSGKVYVFSNFKGSSSSKAFPSLCTFPDSYSSSLTYLPGEMVVNNGAYPAKLFIARQKTTASPSGSPDWQVERKSDGFPMSYATAADRHQLVREQLRYRVKTAGVEPEVTVTTSSGTVVEVKSDILPGEFRTVQLDLRGLPEGFYSLHAESDDQTYQDDMVFYLLQQKESPFAILRLQGKSDIAGYNMLDPQGRLRGPAYELRFRNRATHWRYIGKSFNASSVTANPLPLTRFGVIDNVSVPNKDGIPVDDLPNPEVVMIKAEALTVQAEKRFFTEIHIN